MYLVGSDFLNPATPFSCDVSGNNRTRPMNDSQCEMIKDGEFVQILPCEKWIFDKSIFQSTITMEWNLVCSRAWLSSLFQTIFTIGFFFGSILGGVTTERYGRRSCVRTSASVTVFLTIVMLLSQWLWLVLLTRFLLGVSTAMLACSVYMICMEICDPSLRPLASTFYTLTYAFMMIGMAGLAYWIRDWRPLQAAGSWACVPFVVLAFCIDESPRWLILKGRLEEATQVLQRASRLNQSKSAHDLDIGAFVQFAYQKQNQIQEVQNSNSPKLQPPSGNTQTGSSTNNDTQCSNVPPPQPPYGNDQDASSTNEGNKLDYKSFNQGLGLDDGVGTWWAGPVALLRTKIMAKVTLTVVILSVLQGIVFLGLSLNSDFFSSPFLYVGLLGVFEIPPYIVLALIAKRFERRTIIIVCLFSCGSVLLASAGILLASIENEWLILANSLISYTLISAVFVVMYPYVLEIYPTSLRPWGSAVSSLAICVGFSIAPIIIENTENLAWVPPAVFGSCATVAGSLMFLLPKTNGRSLPETVADLVGWSEAEKPRKRNDNSLDSKQTVGSISYTYHNEGFTGN
ncbi:organic cation transporter protein-like isoform X2 [Palaemon carinicauda]